VSRTFTRPSVAPLIGQPRGRPFLFHHRGRHLIRKPSDVPREFRLPLANQNVAHCQPRTPDFVSRAHQARLSRFDAEFSFRQLLRCGFGPLACE
jgi:hypothetical protein